MASALADLTSECMRRLSLPCGSGSCPPGGGGQLSPCSLGSDPGWGEPAEYNPDIRRIVELSFQLHQTQWLQSPHLPVRLQIRSLEEFGILRISDLFSLRPFSCHFHSCGLQSFFWKTKNWITTTSKMKKDKNSACQHLQKLTLKGQVRKSM